VTAGAVIALGGEYMSVEAWAAVETTAGSALSAFHSLHPMRPGMPAQELRSKLRLNGSRWPAALYLLTEKGIVVRDGPLIALTGHKGGTSSRQDEVNRVLEVLGREPLSPPSGSELVEAARTDTQLLEAMAAEGKIRRIMDGLYFTPDAYSHMLSRTMQIIERDGQVTVAVLRDDVKTSRKYVLSFLEHLDAERITRRMGDVRVLGSKAPTWV
jgi:selenocysteine-specific elongation factor